MATFMPGCSKPTTYEARVQGPITERTIGKPNTEVKVTIDDVLQGAKESGLKSGETIRVDYLTSSIPKNVLDSLEKCGTAKYWLIGPKQECRGEATFTGVVRKGTERTDKYKGKDLFVTFYSPPKKPNGTLEAIKRGTSDIAKSIYEGGQRALEKGGKKWEEIDNEYQLKETFQALSRKGGKALEDGMQELKMFEEKHQIGERAREKAEKAQGKIGELTDDAKKEFKELLRRLRE